MLAYHFSEGGDVGAGRAVPVPRRRRGGSRGGLERGAPLLPGGLASSTSSSTAAAATRQETRAAREERRPRALLPRPLRRGDRRTSTARSRCSATGSAKSALAAPLRFAGNLTACCRGSTCRPRAPAARRRERRARDHRDHVPARARGDHRRPDALPLRQHGDAAPHRAPRRAQHPERGPQLCGRVGIFSYTGVSFGIGRRFLALAEPLLEGRPDAPGYLYYRGDALHPSLPRRRLVRRARGAARGGARRAGSRRPALGGGRYLGLLAEKRSAAATSRASRPCSAASTSSRTASATRPRGSVAGHQVYLLLEQGRFDEAVAAADHYREESPQALLHVLALGARAEAQVRAGALEEAAETLARGEAALAAMGLGQAIPYHPSFLRTARYLFDVATLEGSVRRRAACAGAGARRSARREGGLAPPAGLSARGSGGVAARADGARAPLVGPRARRGGAPRPAAGARADSARDRHPPARPATRARRPPWRRMLSPLRRLSTGSCTSTGTSSASTGRPPPARGAPHGFG